MLRILAGLLLLLAGCSRQVRTPVVVYSPHGKELLSDFQRRYEADHPDQEVRWLDMGSQDAYDRIRTERDNPQADVWWGAPMLTFVRAEREGLLQQYVPTWDTTVPADEKSRNGFWYGTFLTPEVILYNAHAVDSAAAPHDWNDLLEPRWKGKIIIRSPLASGTMRIVFGALIDRELARTGSVESGFDWLRRLDASTKVYAADPTQLYLKIAREEGLVTVWDLPDVVVTAQTYGYPFAYTLPASGTPVITDCIAIVKGAPHPAEARAFYEYVTSIPSLTLQATKFARIPARRDIPRSALPGWMANLDLKPLPVDWDRVATHEQEWMKVWDDRIKGRGTP